MVDPLTGIRKSDGSLSQLQQLIPQVVVHKKTYMTEDRNQSHLEQKRKKKSSRLVLLEFVCNDLSVTINESLVHNLGVYLGVQTFHEKCIVLQPFEADGMLASYVQDVLGTHVTIDPGNVCTYICHA